MGIQLRRIRPNFPFSELTLSRQAGETSFLPPELMPHTASADLVKLKDDTGVFTISFEYSIDEDSQISPEPGPGLIVYSGKYSGKIIEVRIHFRNLDDLVGKTVQLITKLQSIGQFESKESHKKNIQLIVEILNKFQNDVVKDETLRNTIVHELRQ